MRARMPRRSGPQADVSITASELPLGYVNQETFNLPRLRTRLRQWSKDVHSGPGFVVIRGYPVHTLSPAERVVVFAGVASYIGNIRARQGQGGAALSHVIDLTDSHAGSIGNPAFTAGTQAMHTDPGEIIGMFCIGTAAEGARALLRAQQRFTTSWLHGDQIC
jgi:hypothetical protein